ncbi:MAG: hypothetical protein LBP72_04415 [Dysgonamonadaceae bacterium]|jgi:hypothetical protein|nr:hypothetical protein [Dysgonamonadaceae bacterium]
MNITSNKRIESARQIVLKVAPSKYGFLLELLKNFDFVQIEKEAGDSKEEIIANLTQSFKELQMIKEGKLEGRPAEEFLNEL